MAIAIAMTNADWAVRHSTNLDELSVIFYYLSMEFEFDPEKSHANKEKHGIDFVEAQILWDDLALLEIPARTTDEPRYLVIGRIADKHWSGVITYRGDAIRIISVRRARREEIKLYEGH